MQTLIYTLEYVIPIELPLMEGEFNYSVRNHGAVDVKSERELHVDEYRQ